MHVADDRRVDRLIAAADQFAVEEVFQFVPHDGALGQPEDQARADGRIDEEQFELLAQHAMVAALGLFDLPQMVFELLLAEERGAVEPLQLLARGVAPPVGPRHRQQLERADRAGAGDVRTAAEIDELALPIERNRRLARTAVPLRDARPSAIGPDRGRTGSPLARSISTRSNGSSSATIRAISASIFGKSASDRACSISKS